MPRAQTESSFETAALRVPQWLPGWDETVFRSREHRARPPKHFYLFSLPAADLKRLTGVHKRSIAGAKPRAEDLAIQRQQDTRRIREIARYVRFGFPLSDIVESDEAAKAYRALRKPGWLATAIVVNVLTPGEVRNGTRMLERDTVTLRDKADGTARVVLPKQYRSRVWKPRLAPFEVIDGQHRLWAFEDEDPGPNFALPVVAFVGLDISWQAYLFWTINITPTRINKSLAFDLYPLLRTEDWLERYGGEKVYRETRAQELVESLWSHPDSPWRQRINMLGEARSGFVSQAAWVRALLATFVKSWESRRTKVGGLFGAPMGTESLVLPWGRAQQAAVLIYAWRAVAAAVAVADGKWVIDLRAEAERKNKVSDADAAMFGDGALLGTDQGVRGILYVMNDLLFVRADAMALRKWTVELDTAATDVEAVAAALKSLHAHRVGALIRDIAATAMRFDWRTSSGPGLSKAERRSKAALRGAGGYKEIRQELLETLAKSKTDVGRASKEVMRLLKYS